MELDKNHEKGFVFAFNQMSEAVHETAKDKGFWDSECNDAEKIALMHSELSEALEALRHGNAPDDKIPDYSGVEAELADTVIRIMDYCKYRKFNIAEAIVEKAKFNANRPRMHGGKKF